MMGIFGPDQLDPFELFIAEMSAEHLRELLTRARVEYHLAKAENRRLIDERDRLREKFNEQINSTNPN